MREIKENKESAVSKAASVQERRLELHTGTYRIKVTDDVKFTH